MHNWRGDVQIASCKGYDSVLWKEMSMLLCIIYIHVESVWYKFARSFVHNLPMDCRVISTRSGVRFQGIWSAIFIYFFNGGWSLKTYSNFWVAKQTIFVVIIVFADGLAPVGVMTYADWIMLSTNWWPFCLGLNVLTHCGLVTSYGDRDLDQHWLR